MKEKDTAVFKDLNGLIDHITKLDSESAKAFMTTVQKTIEKMRYDHDVAMTKAEYDVIYDAVDKMYRAYKYANYTPEQNLLGAWSNVQKRALDKVRRFAAYNEAGNPIHIGRWVPGVFAYLYLGNPDKGIVVPDPEKYVEIVPGKDYSGISPAEMKRSLAGSSDNLILPALKGQADSLTHQELEGQKETLESKMENLRSEIEDIKGAKSGELAEMKAEINAMKAKMEAKQQALMAEMEQKKREMAAQLEMLGNQIYLLDSQIYSILCYNGETVQFTKILSGKNAPVSEPIIIFQKLRFLDEELGKLASLYTIQWDELDMFENLLKYNPVARDTFAPYERCVQLIRLSKTGKLTGKFDRQDGLPSNMLDDYEYYHGKTVGIIIRNGDNLYLGWTDESRVHIQDDLVVDFSRTVVMPEPEKKNSGYVSHFDQEREEANRKAAAKEFIDGYISRSFIFNILQGVVDHSNMLPLPAGAHLGKQSEYVVYSMADGALPDNRFGTFNEIIDKCNSKLKVGDILLTTQSLSPEYYTHQGRYQSWNNPRGRGSANRTHDADVDDCTLYPLNVIDVEVPSKKLLYRRKGSETWYWIRLDSCILEDETDFNWIRNYRDHGKYKDMTDEQIREAAIALEDVDGKTVHVLPPEDNVEEMHISQPDSINHIFVSVEKGGYYSWNDSETKARANFELYSGEYINLTFMNSVWLEYIISSQKLGHWTVGGKTVDYAYGIRYLKTALDHVRKREEVEKSLIDAIDPEICKDTNWPLKLTEWKMEKDVHNITAYQAKRFVKAMKGMV